MKPEARAAEGAVKFSEFRRTPSGKSPSDWIQLIKLRWPWQASPAETGQLAVPPANAGRSEGYTAESRSVLETGPCHACSGREGPASSRGDKAER